MTTTLKGLLTNVIPPDASENAIKITVVGSGAVGMACAFSMLTQQVASHICLIDANEKVVTGEGMDVVYGNVYLNDARVTWSTDYAASKGSRICVVTAGARQREGETRLDLVKKNVGIFKSIIPKLAEYSPNCILLIITNPCDILTYVAMKLSNFPSFRCIGAGTTLDSARFRYLISQRLNCSSSSVNAWIIGEHGDSSVPLWSSANVSGVRLRDINPKLGLDGDPEDWNDLHKQVVDSAYKIISLKGYTSWGIGLSASKICMSIVRDTREVMPVSVHIKGCKHGVDKDVFLSLPCVIGGNGIVYIVKQSLTDQEKDKLQKSADAMYNVQKGLEM